MISMAVYDESPEEIKMLQSISRELAAKLTEERWEMNYFASFKELCAYIEKIPLLDLLIYDVTRPGALDYLRQIRKSYRLAQILILADSGISPMAYMKPDIHADSLLIRPWTAGQAWEVTKELVREYMRHINGAHGAGEQAYVIESQEGKLRIPYDKIYYFEARAKKIYMCAGKEEFGFYYTLDKLSEELPEMFMRCHRGYIVNSRMIRRVMLSRNIIYLEDGYDVPLSRSYKTEFRGFGR